MAKEFEVIDIGYIGSFIQERADNDGDNLRKDVSLSMIDNNVYFVNPVTGLLELNITANQKTNQLIETNPTGSITSFVIQNIGKTIRITNVTNTEGCINSNISGSNYVYNGVSFPSGSKSCQKSIYFTSNNHIVWPRVSDTNAILEDLTKKIPNDIGFSKKYYKIDYLSEQHLLHLENETKISMDFFKNFPVLFLFDSEYQDNVNYSSVKLSNEWNGYTIDKNNRNNLVYSDFYKTDKSDYANFVFLVSDKMLDNIKNYFMFVSDQKTKQTDISARFNPTLWINEREKEKQKYGPLVSFENNDTNFTEKNIIDILVKNKIYEIDSNVTDIELVEDIAATDFFMQIVNQEKELFTINNTVLPRLLETGDDIFLQDRINFINSLFEMNRQKILDHTYSINKKVLNLLESYFRFQLNNNLPTYQNIIFNMDSFDNLLNDNRFNVITDNPFDTEKLYLINFNEETNLFEIIASLIDTNQNQNNNLSLENITETTALTTLNVEQTNLNLFTYKKFVLPNDVVYSDIFFKTKPLFDNNSDRIDKLYSKPVYDNHSKYYMSIYSKNDTTGKEFNIFNISYAHKDGLGSSFVKDNTELYPAKVMYKKYMADCFGNADILTFKNGKTSEYFYVIEFNQDLFKDRIDNTTFQISLTPLSSSSNQLINTGSNYNTNTNSDKIFTLIDDSKIKRHFNDVTYDINEYYSLVEGTIQQGLYDEEELDIWGLIFPNKGLVILDGKTLDYSCSFNTVTASIDGDNINKLFVSISGSLSPNNTRNNREYWYLRSAELYSDQNYFCRIGQNEFNLTNNYTYISGSNKTFFTDIINNTTKTYITTVGLYNDTKELLAVAKLSKPLLKDSSMEYTINIKLKTN